MSIRHSHCLSSSAFRLLFVAFSLSVLQPFSLFSPAQSVTQPKPVTSGTAAPARPAPVQNATSSATPASGDDEDVIQLGVFDVRAERDEGYMATNVESATRLDAAIVDIPQNITVFNEEFLKDVLATTIDDVVMFDATVNVYGDGWGDDYTMRGMGGDSVGGAGATFYNGFEQQSGRGLQTLVNTQRVEILKGPNAVLYGQGAFGGTINRTSKKPQFRNRTWARGWINSTGHHEVHVDNQAPLVRGKLAYRLNMLYGAGTMWDSSPRDIFAVSPVISWRLGKRTELILEYACQRVKGREGYAEQPIFDSDPLNAVMTGSGVKVPIPLKYTGADGDYRLVRDGIGYLDFRHEFNRFLSLRAMANSEHKTVDYLETHAAGMYAATRAIMPDGSERDGVFISRHARWLDQQFENYRFRVEFAVNNYPTGIIKHKALIGAGYENLHTYSLQRWTGQYYPSTYDTDGNPYYDFSNFNANRSVLPADLLAYQTEPMFWTKDKLYRTSDDYVISARNLSFYISDLMSLFNDRIYLQFGLRYADMQRRLDDKGVCNNYRYTDETADHKLWEVVPESDQVWTDAVHENFRDHPLTHSAGIVWHITRDKSWTFYFNNNATYKPNYTLRYITEGDHLKPMTGIQYEAGFKWVYKSKLYATASYYDIKQKNMPWLSEITRIGDGGEEVSDWGYTTIPGLHSKGVELQFTVNLSNRFRAMFSYAYTDCTNMVDLKNAQTQDLEKRHYNVSRHAAAALLSYRSQALRGLTLTGGFQWRDSQLSRYVTPGTVREEPQWMVPRFLEIRGGGSYNFKVGKTNWTARVECRNLTDEKNAQVAFNVRVVWRSPRMTTFSLETSF
jgi:outer membrane receptor protein involved in Fe transport